MTGILLSLGTATVIGSMKRTLPPLLLLPLLLSCGGSSASLPPDPALVAIYCDLAMAAGDAGPAAPDSVRAEIFALRGTTQEEYEAALAPYREDPSGWVEFFRAVTDTLAARVIQQYSSYRSTPPAPPPAPPPA